MARLDRLLAGEIPTLAAFVDAWAGACPGLAELARTPLDPDRHGVADAARHTDRVLAALADETSGLPAAARAALAVAAALHDIGRAGATRRDPGGRAVSPRHGPRGRAAAARELVDAPGLPWTTLSTALGLVGEHAAPAGPPEAAAGPLRRRARRADLDLLTRLARADARSRRSPDADLERIAAFDAAWRAVAPEAWTGPWRDAVADALAGRPAAARDLALGEALRRHEAGRLLDPAEVGFLAHRVPDDPPELVVLCGPSGSGKSTFAARHLADHAAVSLDDLRAELAGDRAAHDREGEVRQAARARLRGALRPGRKVVWDATALRPDVRAPLRAVGEDYGALVTFVAILQPAAAVARRNREREEAVPARVLADQLARWELPTPDEADRVLVLDGAHAVRSAHGLVDDALPYGLRWAEGA